MKTYLFNFRMMFMALGALMMLGLSSCDKDTDEIGITTGEEVTFRGGNDEFGTPGDGEVDLSVADRLLDEINYGAISVDAELGTLKFATDEDLQRTLELLEEADEALQEEIVSSGNGLEEEEADELLRDEDYALETFESNFPGFTTFRAMAAAEIEEYFSNEELDDENDPSDVYGAIPEVLGTVLNVHGEVTSYDGSVLDKQVHVARLDGSNFTVRDGVRETVLDIRNGMSNDELRELPNIKVVDEPQAFMPPGDRCDANETEKTTRYYTTGTKLYRAKAKLRIQNFSFLWWNKHRAYSELKSRRKSGWWWKKHSTSITITQRGNVYPSTYTSYDCSYWEYNPDTYQWEYVPSICTYENRCAGAAQSAYTHGTKHTWKHTRTRNYSTKVSASDKDGYSGKLRSTFSWKGQTFTLLIF